MRIIRYEDETGTVRCASLQPDGSAVRVVGDILGSFEVTTEPAHVLKLLAPVVPTNVLGIGRNYAVHAPEGHVPPPDYPIVFMKATTAVQDPGAPIVLPRHLPSNEVDYECELAVVIGRRCKDVAPERALDYVLGYTCANDVSARDWQDRWGGGQWWRGKSFDTFAPLGPCLVFKDEIPDPSALRVRTILNGEVMQDASTADLIFDIRALIAFLSGDTTLLPGTVILTGTPSGTGASRKPQVFLRAGDTVTVDIDGIGALVSPVVAEA
ncbi:MAG: fumarylacetoacetate hydrolase family protein [Candidatus Limnocylindrales bacterium]|jgi:2-keto-4-pentenoate hydratase/2-oxohepta-3-ene-1,7-dioic acid hydratase in catechol pathway